METKLTGIPIADPDTPEWEAARARFIGASEAAAACGVSPWMTPRELYAIKTGEITQSPNNGDDVWFGKQHEPTITAAFERFVGIPVAVRPLPMLQHEQHAFMAATPDAQISDSNLGEWKATRIQRAVKLNLMQTEVLPEECADWILQAQQQMAVTGAPMVWFGVLIDGFTFRAYRCERHDGLIDMIVDAERELWERIVNRDPPDPDWTHPGDRELVRQLFDSIDGTRIAADAEIVSIVEERAELGKQIKLLKDRDEALKAQLLYRLGNAYAAVLPGEKKMIRRKKITAHVAAHTKEYIDCRIVNFDGGPVVFDNLESAKLFTTEARQSAEPLSDLAAVEAEPIDDLFHIAEVRLRQAGFNRYATSDSGSRYYIHGTEPLRVRVSSHPPNAKTAARMDDEFIGIRTDLGRYEFDQTLALACAYASGKPQETTV